jgi:hypothetical protein
LFQALFTAGRLWLNFGIVCSWMAVLVVVARLATPVYGAAGLAFAYLAAWSVSVSLYWSGIYASSERVPA